MNKSQRIRSSDLRNIYRLIGECRNLGADPVAWRRQLLEGIRKLTGARVAYAVGLHSFPGPAWKTDEMTLLGLEGSRQAKLFEEHVEYMAREGDPLLQHFATLPLDRPQTLRGVQAYDAQKWRRSESFQRYHRAMDLDPGILSMCPVGDRRSQCHNTLTVRRSVGEPEFSVRETRLLDWLHQELARELGRTLALADEPSENELPPRMRETLQHLLNGQSEKQIADHMGIRRATVHEYVTGIYRRYHVGSRSELMARWIRYGTGNQSDTAP